VAESGEIVEFTFDGRPVRANAGQTLAGALHAAHIHILSRSFKYHRPRGLFCCAGRCPNCLCTVDGTPNVRICTTEARGGMAVRSQNAWPSLTFDLFSVFDKFDRFMPVGFYYKRFFRPRWMWPIWEKFIRCIAGLGQVDPAHGAEGMYDKQNWFADVAVVGGGVAGLHAAWEAAEAGVDVTLIDEQPGLGGHVRHDPDVADGKLADNLAELVVRVTGHARIRVLESATAFGCYEENYLGIQQGNRLIRLRASQVVVATGGWERPLVFAGNDLTGNLLASGAQRLLHLDRCRLPGAAVIVTDNSQGYRMARQLAAADTTVAAIVDMRNEVPEADTAVLSQGRLLVHIGHTILAARGGRHVTGAVIAPHAGGAERTVACRWIVQAVGFTPATSLLYQAGCRLRHNPVADQPLVEHYAPGIHSAGSVNGTHDPAVAAHEGRRAGLAAAAAVRTDDAVLAARVTGLPPAFLNPQSVNANPHYVTPSLDKKKFVCICEDVTEKDVLDAIDEGYANIETLKRYSTVSMGPCQGKMCQAACVAICARENGQSIEETGVPTSRPPEQPVPLGVLAGRGVHFTLVRRTPMHAWHERHGARFMDAGNWKRPERYTTPEQEYQAVRTAAGLIDVSTLGKLELGGRDAVAFLEHVYPNRFADLKVGRTRYGVVCDGAGIILDDGTVSRLDDSRFFLTTTTGNAEAIESWFRWHLAGRPEWDVQLTNVGPSYAGMSLAGPRSREILAKLTTADLSAKGLPYLAVGQFDVAGVPALVFRIGFVGELGYEIHVPAHYGLHVWERIYEAGQPLGLKPFGVEAQRRLRLDKKHILVSIDTDALSNPIEADLGWLVKLDKPDFVGKQSLARVKERGARQRLIGFRMADGVVPDEASLIVQDGKLAGRVTSARFSQAAGAAVGLAWVPVELANDGGLIQISIDGQLHTATVAEKAFYDPAGERLRG
jgi:sarcosine oxidase subunit alpha